MDVSETSRACRVCVKVISKVLREQNFNVEALVVVFFSYIVNTNMFPLPMNDLC